MIIASVIILVTSIFIYLWARASLVLYLKQNWPTEYMTIGSPWPIKLFFAGITIADGISEKLEIQAPHLLSDIKVKRMLGIISAMQFLFVAGYVVGMVAIVVSMNAVS